MLKMKDANKIYCTVYIIVAYSRHCFHVEALKLISLKFGILDRECMMSQENGRGSIMS